MIELSQTASGHITRDKKGKDHALEQLLEIWGAWRDGAVLHLGIGISPLEGAVQRLSRPGWQLTTKGWRPTSSGMAQPKETRVVRPNIPRYYTKPFISKINRAILSLQEKHRITLIRKYEDCWETRDFGIQWGWEANTTYNRLAEARSAARNHKDIKFALRRA